MARTGFSKGTADVTQSDVKKLSPLIAHYRKSPKPFTQCVLDNTKRWGKDVAEKRCAVLKDVMKGTTKWRSGNQKGK